MIFFFNFIYFLVVPFVHSLIKCLINLLCSFVNSCFAQIYKVKKYFGGYNILIVANENFELLAILAKRDFFLTANTGLQLAVQEK